MFLSAKSHIESLYEDTCTIYKASAVKAGGRTSTTWTAAYEGIPCRLSFSSIAPGTASDTADEVNQTVKLFVSPSVDVPDGSRIVVKRSTGHVSNWSRSGKPAVYPTHQEIMLAPLEVHA